MASTLIATDEGNGKRERKWECQKENPPPSERYFQLHPDSLLSNFPTTDVLEFCSKEETQIGSRKRVNQVAKTPKKLDIVHLTYRHQRALGQITSSQSPNKNTPKIHHLLTIIITKDNGVISTKKMRDFKSCLIKSTKTSINNKNKREMIKSPGQSPLEDIKSFANESLTSTAKEVEDMYW